MVTGMAVTGLGVASMILGSVLVFTGPTGCAANDQASCDDPQTYGFLSFTAGLAVGLGGAAMWTAGAAEVPAHTDAEARRPWVAVGPSGVAFGGQF